MEVHLTPRETELLTYLVRGLGNKQIAQAMDPPCSVATVKWHLQHIFSKLHIENRMAAALWAVHNGFAYHETTKTG